MRGRVWVWCCGHSRPEAQGQRRRVRAAVAIGEEEEDGRQRQVREAAAAKAEELEERRLRRHPHWIHGRRVQCWCAAAPRLRAARRTVWSIDSSGGVPFGFSLCSRQRLWVAKQRDGWRDAGTNTAPAERFTRQREHPVVAKSSQSAAIAPKSSRQQPRVSEAGWPLRHNPSTSSNGKRPKTIGVNQVLAASPSRGVRAVPKPAAKRASAKRGRSASVDSEDDSSAASEDDEDDYRLPPGVDEGMLSEGQYHPNTKRSVKRQRTALANKERLRTCCHHCEKACDEAFSCVAHSPPSPVRAVSSALASLCKFDCLAQVKWEG